MKDDFPQPTLPWESRDEVPEPDFESRPPFLTKASDISKWLAKYCDISGSRVPAVTIINGQVIIHGDIKFRINAKIPYLRVSFSSVEGTFCCGNTLLKSLEGCPVSCDRFSCDNCPELQNLKGGPTTVTKAYSCSSCRGLTSLEGAPETVDTFYANDCTSLTNFNFLPTGRSLQMIRSNITEFPEKGLPFIKIQLQPWRVEPTAVQMRDYIERGCHLVDSGYEHLTGEPIPDWMLYWDALDDSCGFLEVAAAFEQFYGEPLLLQSPPETLTAIDPLDL